MTPLAVFVILVIGIAIGLGIARLSHITSEGFGGAASICGSCGEKSPCECPHPTPQCKQPDMSKFVLKSSIPPCPAVPDMSNYILKSECPPVPDLSNYVLKSSIPKQQPVILDCSKCQKPKGECPPCPRPRCPEVICPAAPSCPTCAPCPRTSCPPTTVKCKAEHRDSDQGDSIVRPYMAPLNFRGFGMN